MSEFADGGLKPLLKKFKPDSADPKIAKPVALTDMALLSNEMKSSLFDVVEAKPTELGHGLSDPRLSHSLLSDHSFAEPLQKKLRRKPQCSKCGGEGHTAKNKLCPGHHADLNSVESSTAIRKRITERGGTSANIDDIFELSKNVDDGYSNEDFVQDADMSYAGEVEAASDDENLNTFTWEKCDFTLTSEIPEFISTQTIFVPLPSSTHLDAFRCFITDEICANFIEASNSYGSLHISNWDHAITPEEFKKFIAIILVLSLTGIQNPAVAWDSIMFNMPFLKSLMTLSRFNQLLRAWHYEDYKSCTQDQLKENRSTSPFWPAVGFISKLTSIFQSVFHLYGQHLLIDDMLIPWDQAHDCRYYDGDERGKGHFKLCALSDAESGYVHNMFLYEGPRYDPPPKGVSNEVYGLQKLMCPLELYSNKNHVIATGSDYTSIDALKFVTLHTKNVYMGELSSRRGNEDIPSESRSQLGDQSIRDKTGSYQLRTKLSEEADLCAYLVSWRGTNPPLVLASLPSTLTPVDGLVVAADGGMEKATVWRPSAVELCRRRSVCDGGEHAATPFRVSLGTNSWLTHVFAHCLNVAVVNSFVLHKKTHNLPKTCLLKDFVIRLVEQLVPADLSPVHVSSSQGKRSRFVWQLDQRRRTNVGSHNPVIDREPVLEGDKIRNNKRSECIICRRKTTVRCQSCNAYVCVRLYRDQAVATCWQRFHNDAVFPAIAKLKEEEKREERIFRVDDMRLSAPAPAPAPRTIVEEAEVTTEGEV